ncbi:MlaD family protein [Actinomycetospora endophytica]|uniref:MlaD family protein n=1 Tax=Actinomycetospora endophytica TaxID=2291215 RepID=A0ABS8PJ13_9PSEU|nr:MlaD family protein [Actinomycetospora endophytica]MCD2198246.1 MlaD family protein [Actinomycetospora endophytica]
MTTGRRRWLVIGAAVVIAALLVGGLAVVANLRTYRLQILMPTATGVIAGDKVLMRGQNVGKIDSVEVHDNRDALITVDLDSSVAPLHQGTDAEIVWEAVLLERAVQIDPGPAQAPELESGARILSHHESVELDDVLSALDPSTMKNVDGMIQQLQTTLAGREKETSATLQTAGPAVDALGQVLQGVGSDGPALRQLVTQLHQVTSTLDQRHDQLSGVVHDLDPLTSTLAAQQQQIGQSVQQLPATLTQAKSTLDKVPDATDATVPLLKTLQPATHQLPAAAAALNPVLTNLKPVIHQLGPVLHDAKPLLDETPGLLDTTHAVLPPATQAVGSLRTPVAFLRPYIPEATGWLANWTGVFGNTTADGGHYGRALITEGSTSVNDNPGVTPPGVTLNPAPAPGSVVGQPWADANGDAQR